MRCSSVVVLGVLLVAWGRPSAAADPAPFVRLSLEVVDGSERRTLELDEHARFTVRSPAGTRSGAFPSRRWHAFTEDARSCEARIHAAGSRVRGGERLEAVFREFDASYRLTIETAHGELEAEGRLGLANLRGRWEPVTNGRVWHVIRDLRRLASEEGRAFDLGFPPPPDKGNEVIAIARRLDDGTWGERCLGMVQTAYERALGHAVPELDQGTAHESYLAFLAEGRIRTDRIMHPPRGAIVFYDWWGWVTWPDGVSRYGDYGHVCLSNGDGTVTTTDWWDRTRSIDPSVWIGAFTTSDPVMGGHRLLGWVAPLR